MEIPASVDRLIEQLQKEAARRFAAGVSLHLACEPRVADLETRISIRAWVFAPAAVLSELNPLLSCRQNNVFRRELVADRSVSAEFRDYSISLRAGELGPPGTYVFSLHIKPDASSSGSCTLRVFRKVDLLTSARAIRMLAWPGRVKKRLAKRREVRPGKARTSRKNEARRKR